MASRVLALLLATACLFSSTGSAAGRLLDDAHRSDHHALAPHSHHGKHPHRHSHDQGRKDNDPLPFDSVGLLPAVAPAPLLALTAPSLFAVAAMPNGGPDLTATAPEVANRDTGPPLVTSSSYSTSSSNRAPPLG